VDSGDVDGLSATSLDTLLTAIYGGTSTSQGLQAGAILGLDTSTATGGSFTQGNAITDSTGTGGGSLGLTKLGTGTLVLDKANTYTGATTVAAGTLAITGATQDTSAITFTAGSLGLDTGFPVTAASAAVNLANGTITVTGTTGAPSYTLLTAASITGTPVLATPVSGYTLQVIDGVTDELRLVQTGGGSPYDTWSGGAPFDDDANGDGVPNGLASCSERPARTSVPSTSCRPSPNLAGTW
jgi:autotransporter-associated beta strand protein